MLTKPRIPLLQRRGWMRHQTLEGAAGVVTNIFDHPVCSALERALSLVVAAPPPLEEGNTKRMTHLAFYFGQLCSMSARDVVFVQSRARRSRLAARYHRRADGV